MPASPLPRWINLVVLAGALSSPPVRAQATWNVTLSRDTAGKLVRQGLNRATTFVTTPSVTIVVSCQSVDCRDVRGRVDIQGQGVARDSLPISAASATLVSLTLLRSDAVPVPAPRHLVLFVGGDEADPFLLTAGPTQDPPQVARTLSLTELLSAQCQVRTAGTAYDGTANRADFAVTPLGEVLSRPGDVIDEDDERGNFELLLGKNRAEGDVGVGHGASSSVMRWSGSMVGVPRSTTARSRTPSLAAGSPRSTVAVPESRCGFSSNGGPAGGGVGGV